MNPISVLGNVRYTCTICDSTVVGQARYQQHMKSHRNNENNDPLADQGSVSMTSSSRHTRSHRQPYSAASVNSNSQYEPPPAKDGFKKPHTPASQADRKGKKRQHDASSHHFGDNNSNYHNTNFKRPPSSINSASQYHLSDNDGNSMAPPSRRTGNPMNPVVYKSRVTIFQADDPTEDLDMAAARGRIRTKRANMAKRYQQGFRPISEQAKEEMRKILHSSYSNLLANIGSPLSEHDHNNITELVKRIDKKIRHTMVPISMPTPYPHNGTIADEIKSLTEKLDHIIRITLELELEDFYTKIESQKLKFQLDHLRDFNQKNVEDTSELLAITDEEIAKGYNEDSLPNLPPAMRKYLVNDMVPSYTDDLLMYPSSSFSLRQ